MSTAATPGSTHGGGRRAQRPHDAPSLRHAADSIGPLAALHASAGHRAVRQLLGRGAPLPDDVRAEMEARFGTSFGDVRVHTDAAARDVASAVHAKALACAGDLVFGGGRFTPVSAEGKWLLAHELAHVVQQRRGGAVPEVEGGAFEASLEAGAERAADAAVAPGGPIDVAGASAPGIARSPLTSDRSNAAAGPARGENVVPADGAAGWRQWLVQIESMRFDEAALRWTITIEGQRYALHQAQYQRNLDEANNAIGGQIAKLHQAADTADRIDKGIREIDQSGSWANGAITWLIEHHYGITRPGDALTDAVREARAYAILAKESQHKGEFLAAFEYLESGRVPAERAAKLATEYYEGVMAATQSMQDTIVGSWADLLQLLLGVLKGIGSQATDLADTAFWATDELRSLTGDSTAGLILATAASGPLGPVVAPAVSGLAVGHDALKCLNVVDPSGRVSTTTAFSNTMQGTSDQVTQTLGSNFAPDAIVTPFNIGDLGGALAVQALLASTGVKEVTLVADLAGAASSLRTLVNTYRDNSDWKTDTNFWSAAIGVALSLVGLGNWSGTNRLVAYALKSGMVLTLVPPIEQFRRDLYDEKLESAERNRRLGEDVKRFAQAVFGLVLASRAHPEQEGPDGAPTPAGKPSDMPGSDAATHVAALGEPATAVLPQPPAPPAGMTLAELQPPAEASVSAPRQVLPFKARQGPKAPADPERGLGDLHLLPAPRRRASDEPQAPSAAAERLSLPNEQELPLQMALGQTSWVEPRGGALGPSLVYDADAMVASSAPGGGESPRPVPPSQPKPAELPPRAAEILRPDIGRSYDDTSREPRPGEQRTPEEAAKQLDHLRPVQPPAEPPIEIGAQSDPAAPEAQARAAELSSQTARDYDDTSRQRRRGEDRSPEEVEAVRDWMQPAPPEQQSSQDKGSVALPADDARVMSEDDRDALRTAAERAYWDRLERNQPAPKSERVTESGESIEFEYPADLLEAIDAPPKDSMSQQQQVAHDRTDIEIDLSDEPIADPAPWRDEHVSKPAERTEFEWPTDLVDPMYASPQEPMPKEQSPRDSLDDAFDISDDPTVEMEGHPISRASESTQDLADEPTVELPDEPTLEIEDAPTVEITQPGLDPSEARTVELTDPAIDFADATTVVTNGPPGGLVDVPAALPAGAKPKAGLPVVPPDENERTRRLKRRRGTDR